MSEKIVVGSIVEGKVIRVKPFGAIVALDGNVSGLVHISQISNTFVQDINEHIKVGDTVKVKVVSVDEETNRISLSIKEALPKESLRISSTEITKTPTAAETFPIPQKHRLQLPNPILKKK